MAKAAKMLGMVGSVLQLAWWLIGGPILFLLFGLGGHPIDPGDVVLGVLFLVIGVPGAFVVEKRPLLGGVLMLTSAFSHAVFFGPTTVLQPIFGGTRFFAGGLLGTIAALARPGRALAPPAREPPG
jgi:hypothetical protein